MSGTLRLRGATSGYSELQAPAVAADQTFVLPTAGGTLLTTDSPVPQLTLELGSASEPSLRFEGDTDTGLFSQGTNTLNLVTGGSSKVVLGADSHTIYAGTGASIRAVDIDPGGRVLVGGTNSIQVDTANNTFQIQGTNKANSRISLQRVSDNSAGAGIHLAKARTSGYGLVQANDEVGIIAFNPADGTNYDGQCASIQCFIDGTPGIDDIPGRLTFATTTDNSTTPTERLRIDRLGRIIINDGPDTSVNETLIIKSINGNNPNVVKVFGATTTDGSFAGLGFSSDAGTVYFTAGNNGTGACDLSLRSTTAAGTETTRLFIAGEDAYANFFGGEASNHTGAINSVNIQGGTTNRPRLSLLTNDTSIANNQELGRIDFWNNDGGSWDSLAYIRAVADQDYSAGNKGTYLSFGTTPDGGTSPVENMRISQAGHVTIDHVLNVREAIDLADNDILRFGSSDDVQMVFDGSAFYLKLDNDDDLIITDENSSLNAFRFDTSARRFYAQDNIYAGYNGSASGYNTGAGNSIATYARDSANQTDTWTAYTQLVADWRGKYNEATNESTQLLYCRVKDRAGNQATIANIDVSGSYYGASSFYAGRTRSSTTGTADNYYARAGTGYGFHGYNGNPLATDRLYSTGARAYVHFRASFDDADDRKSLYMVKSDTDGSYDYDQDQYAAIAATGRTDFKGAIRSGRVESDEGAPNSIYAPVGWEGGNGILSYVVNGNSYTAISGRTTANTDYVFRSRVNQTSDKTRIEANGNAFTDGTWSDTNADYAEYFEWEDGNPNDEDRRGVVVVLTSEGKIREATSSDTNSSIIGVISAMPAFVGDSGDLHWHDMYLKDAFGTYVTEPAEYLLWNKDYQDGVPINQPVADDPDTWGACISVPVDLIDTTEIPQWALDQNCRVTKYHQVLNPAYDPTQVYIPRSERREWDPVGLIGKLIVKDGQEIGANWITMGPVGTGLTRYFVR